MSHPALPSQPSSPPHSSGPADQGLYRASAEHDACGVAMVATLRGWPGRDVVDHALTALRNLDHRGAVGAEVDTGDGAGILLQVPDAFLRAVAALPAPLPVAGAYAVGLAFLPDDDDAEARARAGVEAIAEQEGLVVLGWREVPTTDGLVGATARSCQPRFRQLFVAAGACATTGTLDDTTHGEAPTGLALDRLAYPLRKRAERELGIYLASLSSRTLVYKGMLTTGQLEAFFPDLSDARLATELAVVHSRFSTNTFPSWPLAHPFRFIAHNGEINTARGNRNWMATRESGLATAAIGGDLGRLFPVCTPGASDSASFDEVLELLHLGGRTLPHAVLMMIPEAWENHATMDPARRAFYEYHSMTMEPWDGPACVTFSDGHLVGAVLDRNGLRPSRWWITDDGLVVLASEAGVLDLDPATVVSRGRLQPGRMFLVETSGGTGTPDQPLPGRVVPDEEVKDGLAAAHPYAQWLAQHQVRLEDLPEREHVLHTRSSVTRRQQTFGYTEEEMRLLLAPMAGAGTEPVGSMGTDTPLAVLSVRPRLIFDYFVQQFAQVTNPPLDAIREEVVTALGVAMGPEGNLLDATPEHARQLVVPFPVIDNDALAKIVHADADGEHPHFASTTVSGLYPVTGGGEALERRLREICAEVSAAIEAGARFVVLTDRNSDALAAPIPSLLLTSAVHHHLIRSKTRTQVGLVVEAGDVREVHHAALLIGYGAAVVNPYLAMESVEDLVRSGTLTGVTGEAAVANLIRSLGKGVLKVMSKMGISTVASYRGAQVFEAIGLSQDLVDRWFTGTTSQLGGIGMDVVADEVARRHAVAYPVSGQAQAHRRLEVGGEYAWRREGEPHLFDPETVFRLQHATREGRYDVFRRYTAAVDDQSGRLMTLRGLFRVRGVDAPAPAQDGGQGGLSATAPTPVPIEEVEPASEIVKRFSTGAMSYGSISAEAHETLAIAMNRLGAKSNTGEGGEDVERLLDPERRSAVKQVASGRFGVTSAYLTHASDLQIKMAQGAKPGEGGQLPGPKVYPSIARTRGSTPGVGLISPPPHHDIYSIEDLAQLIHDLKNANPTARVHVKLVAESGVGTVAAGVAKAHADVVLVSGHDGGTGAAPLTSLKHAGGPWELGLAETQQTLLLNGLRDRVVVQTDGQMKTGRDVVVAALLGAEEYGFSTAPLVVSGCIMMRVCHLDTCPVGVATQNPELRARFPGKPEFVVTFFEFLAQEVREHLAAMGLRSIDEAVGRTDLLDVRAATEHWKASGLDLGAVLHAVDVPEGTSRRQRIAQDHGLERALDHELMAAARDALEAPSGTAVPVVVEHAVRNVNRSVGTMLGHEVTLRHGPDGLPADTVDITLTGTAGQSLGAFLPAGVTLRLVGDANDYVAKGLSGGRVVLRPHPASPFAAADNVIAGNTLAYGATSGEVLASGRVGERAAVRNSGASIVVEGTGDHAAEYMTGGTVVVLGQTGRNVGAGMSGGVLHLLDADPAVLNPAAVSSGTLTVNPLPDEHEADLRALLVRHADQTGSEVAAALLADGAGPLGERFTTVVPAQYAEVVALRAAAVEREEDPDGAAVWEQILEATRG